MPGVERGKFHGAVASEQKDRKVTEIAVQISPSRGAGRTNGLEVSGMLKKYQEGQYIWSRKNEDEGNRR